MFLIILLIVILFVLYLCNAVYKQTQYWKKFDVPSSGGLKQFQHFLDFLLQRKHLVTLGQEAYNLFPDKRYMGYSLFSNPGLLIRDLDLIKQLTIKDFDHFTDHTSLLKKGGDRFMDKNLLSLTGNEWREMRATLSPAFTSAKMRNMFVFISECAKDFAQHFIKKNDDCIEVDTKDIFNKYTLQIIASTSFGINCNCLENSEDEFYKISVSLLKTSTLQTFKGLLFIFLPSLSRLLKLTLFPTKIYDFFHDIVHGTIAKREEQNIFRPDLLQLLSDARKGKLKHENKIKDQNVGFATVEESDVGKKEEYQKKIWTDDDVTAQSLLFFFAGFDTSSTISGFMAYELVQNPDVQEKLQQEIDAVRENCIDGMVTYDILLKMKYLDQVLSETLRLWTPGFQTDRVCTKEYQINPERPDETVITLKKGNSIIIPIHAIHRDPQYYPNPDKFDPERFNDENKSNIKSGSYLPFGTGPRNCIGSRFALLAVKSLFFYLLSEFDLVKTEKSTTFVLDPKIPSLSSAGIYVGLKPRKKTQ